jgi:AcrR family transcriptional regulator
MLKIGRDPTGGRSTGADNLTDIAVLDRDEAPAGGKSTQSDWLNLAIETLVNEGIDQVKVQVMARKLGVSRSSFYWFFESIQDLQAQLMSHWLRRNTEPIIERAMRPASNVVRAVCNVFECWVDPVLFDPNLDAAVRYWGRRDPAVRSIVDQADARRLDAVARMFMRYDFPEEEAVIRARVLYFTQIGHYTLEVREDPEVRMSHLRSYLLTFTGHEPRPGDMESFKRLADRVAAAGL